MILMIEPSGKAGLGHYTYNLCNALFERGKEVHLLTAANYELENYPIKFNAERVFKKCRTSPFKLAQVVRYFHKRNPQIVHFQGADHPTYYLFFLYLLRAAIDCPVVYTAHNIIPRRPKSVSKKAGFFLKILYQFVDSIIVHSEISRMELIKLSKISPHKVKVIAHGDYTFFAPQKRTEVRLDGDLDEKYILFFGYIVRVKGLMYLIRAMKEIVKTVPNAKLLIVGFPSENFNRYQREIRKLGLVDKVITVLKYVPLTDLSHFFSMCHVVALPYLDVSQSGVLQIAFAFGKPVVATTTGGLQELIEDGKGGYLVPPMDFSRLAYALTLILKNDKIRKKMGEYNYKISRVKHQWSEIAEKTERIYLGAA